MDDGSATLQIDFEGGESAVVQVAPGEPLLLAARRAGIIMASDCRRGQCKTCRCSVMEGSVSYPPDIQTTLTAEDFAEGAVLPCVARASADVRLYAAYRRESLLPLKTKFIEVVALDRLSDTLVRLQCKLAATTKIDFLPGQYCKIQLPGTDQERSYFMGSSQKDWPNMEFLVRARPGGLMSDYLTRAAAGDKIRIRGPMGGFYLRETPGLKLMVAGGTGIAPMLSMLSALKHHDRAAERIILLHLTREADKNAFTGTIAALANNFPHLDVRLVTVNSEEAWDESGATVADRIDASEIAELSRSGAVYVCGSTAMVGGVRRSLAELGIAPERVHAEEVIPAVSAVPA